MTFKTEILAVLTAAVLASTMAVAAEEPSEQVKRMDAAATVFDEIMGTPDKGFPKNCSILRSAWPSYRLWSK